MWCKMVDEEIESDGHSITRIYDLTDDDRDL